MNEKFIKKALLFEEAFAEFMEDYEESHVKGKPTKILGIRRESWEAPESIVLSVAEAEVDSEEDYPYYISYAMVIRTHYDERDRIMLTEDGHNVKIDAIDLLGSDWEIVYRNPISYQEEEE